MRHAFAAGIPHRVQRRSTLTLPSAVVEVASGEHGTEMDALYKAIDADAQHMAQPALETGEDVPADAADGEADAMLQPGCVALDMEKAAQACTGAPPSCSGYPVAFRVQFAVLFKRSLVLSWRDMVRSSCVWRPLGPLCRRVSFGPVRLVPEHGLAAVGRPPARRPHPRLAVQGRRQRGFQDVGQHCLHFLLRALPIFLQRAADRVDV